MGHSLHGQLQCWKVRRAANWGRSGCPVRRCLVTGSRQTLFWIWRQSGVVCGQERSERAQYPKISHQSLARFSRQLVLVAAQFLVLTRRWQRTSPEYPYPRQSPRPGASTRYVMTWLCGKSTRYSSHRRRCAATLWCRLRTGFDDRTLTASYSANP